MKCSCSFRCRVAARVVLLACLAGWSDECQAASEAPTKKPPQVIVLKLDDVVAHDAKLPVSPRWQRTVDFLEKRGLKASLGIIGFSLEEDNPAYFQWDDRRWQGFVEIIDFLQARGCEFMTPSAYMQQIAAAEQTGRK